MKIDRSVSPRHQAFTQEASKHRHLTVMSSWLEADTGCAWRVLLLVTNQRVLPNGEIKRDAVQSINVLYAVQYLLHVNNVPPIIRGRVKPEDTCLVNHEIRQVVSNHRQAQPQRLKQHVQTLTCLWLKQPFRRPLFDRSHRRVF